MRPRILYNCDHFLLTFSNNISGEVCGETRRGGDKE